MSTRPISYGSCSSSSPSAHSSSQVKGFYILSGKYLSRWNFFCTLCSVLCSQLPSSLSRMGVSISNPASARFSSTSCLREAMVSAICSLRSFWNFLLALSVLVKSFFIYVIFCCRDSLSATLFLSARATTASYRFWPSWIFHSRFPNSQSTFLLSLKSYRSKSIANFWNFLSMRTRALWL